MGHTIWARLLVCILWLCIAGATPVRADEDEEWESITDVDRALDSGRKQLAFATEKYVQGEVPADEIERAVKYLYARVYAGVEKHPSLYDRVKGLGKDVPAPTLWRFLLLARDYLVLERKMVQKAYVGWFGIDEAMATFSRGLLHSHQRSELRGSLAILFGDHAVALMRMVQDQGLRVQVHELGADSLKLVLREVYFPGQDTIASQDGFGSTAQIDRELSRGIEALVTAAQGQSSRGSNDPFVAVGEAVGCVLAGRIQAGWLVREGRRDALDKVMGTIVLGCTIASYATGPAAALLLGALEIVGGNLASKAGAGALQAARERLLASSQGATAAHIASIVARMSLRPELGDHRLLSLVRPVEAHLHDLELEIIP